MVSQHKNAQRGDIWLINLDPTVGSEIQKTRPCIIISPEELNANLRTVIVAPMTSQGFAAPFRPTITHAGKQGRVVLDQLRAVDKKRLVKKVGAAPQATLELILHTLQELFTQ